ncbi:DUF1440 domain-containing protein [Dyella terrae]|uniref:DUF1440 domain-containing protein n=1 Tax=Dyella terrae TaxID=522259 RepID=UPI001EFE22A5|nr:DUF1440 domain-containing protein [Dyella terrae]ULU25819.1 hypothetical protein DYST_02756 [Dyella terrae]
MNSLSERPTNPLIATTLIAGTLDLLSAVTYALLEGKNPLAIPVGIASAIWPGAIKAGAPALVVGVLLHFIIMFVMVAVFLATARKIPWLTAKPFASGVLYGLLLWAVMNLIVLPLRWPSLFPHITALSFGEQIFSHTVLVGLPIAWMASRATKHRDA